MSNDFNIHDNTVHLWRLFMPDFAQEKNSLSSLLSSDEMARTEQFHFPIHNERFTITRGLLRRTLSFYTGIDPQAITFQYGEHGKPSLADANLTFNVSHSDDMALFAFTIHKPIGIDIEKMTTAFKGNVAKRFFSAEENEELIEMGEKNRIIAFYKMWSRKEALIKVLGQGLFTPLHDFTVSAKPESQTILLEDTTYTIHHINAHHDYQAAFAVPAPLSEIIRWEWTPQGPQCW